MLLMPETPRASQMEHAGKLSTDDKKKIDSKAEKVLKKK
jgi:hypothetical protein